MEMLPLMLDGEDAIDFYRSTPDKTDAFKAKVIAVMITDGFSNGQIRDELKIQKDYVVSHYKRVGTTLNDEQLQLWHNNPSNITLGHARAVSSMKSPALREQTLRKLLTTKISVAKLEKMAATGEQQDDIDDIEKHLKQYAGYMSEVTGRVVDIKMKKGEKMGKITLSWTGYDDLDDVAKALGFKPSDYM